MGIMNEGTLKPEQFFQVQAVQTELRARYSTMLGIKSLFLAWY